MREWIEVDLDTEKLKQKKEIRGVVVELLVSPYDVPEAVRGFFDVGRSRFAIEFRYIGGNNEPTKNQVYDELVLATGENSGRLYHLEIDVAALKANSVELRMLVEREVSEALDQLIQRSGRINRRDNYRLAKEAIAARQDQLFGALAQAA